MMRLKKPGILTWVDILYSAVNNSLPVDKADNKMQLVKKFIVDYTLGAVDNTCFAQIKSEDGIALRHALANSMA